MVSVGLAEGLSALVIGARHPLRLRFDERRTPKTLYASADTRFEFRSAASTPARRRWWVRVGEFDMHNAEGLAAAGARWRARGFRPRAETSGALLAVGGAVLDTRRRELLIGGGDQASAERLAERVFREHHLRAGVRVTLVEPARGRIRIRQVGTDRVYEADGRVYVGTVDGGELVYGARRFAGHMYVSVGPTGGLALVNSVDAETLLRGLVPAEIFSSAPAAALEAQAIVARGAILSMLGGRHFESPFHLCSDQHCQVYKGMGLAHPATDAAIESTRGLIAVRPRSDPSAPLQLVESVYSASCGGFSAANEVVWDQKPAVSLRPRLDGPLSDPALARFRDGVSGEHLEPWMSGFPPTYCARASLSRKESFRWTRTLEADELQKLGRSLGIGPIIGIEALGRGKGGRVIGVRIRGTQGAREILRELPVRRALGNLRSGAFVFEPRRNKDGHLTQLKVVGAGWGHGVGLCQMGAIGRAEAGHTARQILAHYYSGATLERLYR